MKNPSTVEMNLIAGYVPCECQTMPDDNQEDHNVEQYQDELSEKSDDGGGYAETWNALNKYRQSKSPSITRRSVLKATGTTVAGLTTGAGVVAGETGEKMVYVPSGELVPASQVQHAGTAGFGVKPETPDAPDKKQGIHSNDPDSSGWFAYTRDHFKNGEYSRMVAEINVPNSPPKVDGTQDPLWYIFPALQNCDDFCTNTRYILQPVLQYNWAQDGYDFSNQWSMAAWYKSPNDDKYYHSTPIGVNEGENLWGNMDKGYNTDNDAWYIEFYNESTGQHTDITTPAYPSGMTFDRAFTTLEGYDYNYGECDTLPGDMKFFAIYLVDSNGNEEQPEWGTHKDGNMTCNVNVSVVSNDTTKITTPN